MKDYKKSNIIGDCLFLVFAIVAIGSFMVFAFNLIGDLIA